MLYDCIYVVDSTSIRMQVLSFGFHAGRVFTDNLSNKH